jgi:hypothetical protein
MTHHPAGIVPVVSADLQVIQDPSPLDDRVSTQPLVLATIQHLHVFDIELDADADRLIDIPIVPKKHQLEAGWLHRKIYTPVNRIASRLYGLPSTTRVRRGGQLVYKQAFCSLRFFFCEARCPMIACAVDQDQRQIDSRVARKVAKK